jgi:hypothetical protein
MDTGPTGGEDRDTRPQHRVPEAAKIARPLGASVRRPLLWVALVVASVVFVFIAWGTLAHPDMPSRMFWRGALMLPLLAVCVHWLARSLRRSGGTRETSASRGATGVGLGLAWLAFAASCALSSESTFEWIMTACLGWMGASTLWQGWKARAMAARDDA